MRMILNYELGRVSVAVFDDEWNEKGRVWKKNEFEQEFGILLPNVRHITIDEVNESEVVIGDVENRDSILRSLKEKRNDIIASII